MKESYSSVLHPQKSLNTGYSRYSIVSVLRVVRHCCSIVFVELYYSMIMGTMIEGCNPTPSVRAFWGRHPHQKAGHLRCAAHAVVWCSFSAGKWDRQVSRVQGIVDFPDPLCGNAISSGSVGFNRVAFERPQHTHCFMFVPKSVLSGNTG